MRVSLTALVRLIVFGFLGLNLVAIGVGRMFPEGPQGRRLRSVQESQVNTFACARPGSSPLFLDAESCNLRTLVLPAGDRLVNARCSPWIERGGEAQVVGQWSSLSSGGISAGAGTVGLARFTFPSGEPLDRIETDVYPASPPCWLPGTGASVLFAAGDGKLYRYDFEEKATVPGVAQKAPGKPVELTWKSPLPGEGGVFLGDPCWVSLKSTESRLMVTLSSVERRDGRLLSTPNALWWLKLDPDAKSIIDSGPVFDGSPETDRHRRFPAYASRPGVGTVIAHLSRRLGEGTWNLEIAPLRVDPETGNPVASLIDLKTVTTGCAATAPAFSVGGRWISCILPDDGEIPRGIRLEVDDAEFTPASGRAIYTFVDSHSDNLRHVRRGGDPSSTMTGGSSQRIFGETRSTYPISRSDLTSAM